MDCLIDFKFQNFNYTIVLVNNRARNSELDFILL